MKSNAGSPIALHCCDFIWKQSGESAKARVAHIDQSMFTKIRKTNSPEHYLKSRLPQDALVFYA